MHEIALRQRSQAQPHLKKSITHTKIKIVSIQDDPKKFQCEQLILICHL